MPTTHDTRVTGLNVGPSKGPGASRPLPGATYATIDLPASPGTGPSTGPIGTGPTGAPGPVPTPGVTTSGNPGGGPTGGITTGTTDSGGYYVDPGFNSAIASSFLNILQSSTSPDALEAQNIILRRIALEGDVIGSRVPPPKTPTEVGGWLNYLTTLNQFEMRAQVVAAILGVAGPSPPLGWMTNAQPTLAFKFIPNDRPAGPAQMTIPITFGIRSDFATAFQAALAQIHNSGAMLPIAATPQSLPTSSGNGMTTLDPLPYMGRALQIVPGVALANPGNDAIALVRKNGTTDPFQLAARVINTGSIAVTPDDYEVVQCTSNSQTTIVLTGASYVLLAPVLGNAGFYPATPLPVPATLADTPWSRLTNLTGLIQGLTTLGDELGLVYSWTSIESSVFGDMSAFVWDGTQFSPPP